MLLSSNRQTSDEEQIDNLASIAHNVQIGELPRNGLRQSLVQLRLAHRIWQPVWRTIGCDTVIGMNNCAPKTSPTMSLPLCAVLVERKTDKKYSASSTGRCTNDTVDHRAVNAAAYLSGLTVITEAAGHFAVTA
jgi:hypothetical protein